MGKQKNKQEDKHIRIITKRMGIEEIIPILREDLKKNVYPYSWRKHIVLNQKVRGMTHFPSGVDSFSVCITPGMKWGVRLFALRKEDWERQDMTTGQFYCMIESEAGAHVYFFTSMDTGEDALFVFPPHFFIRYHERYWKKKSTLYGDSLKKVYLKDNLVLRYGLQPGTEKRVTGARIYGASAHGVALGEVMNDNAYIFKTFITYEMTKGEQVPLYMQQRLSAERTQVEYYRTGKLVNPVELEKRERKRLELLRAEVERLEKEKERKEADPGEPYFYIQGPLGYMEPEKGIQDGIVDFWTKSIQMHSDPKLIEETIQDTQNRSKVEPGLLEGNAMVIKKTQTENCFGHWFRKLFGGSI